MSHQVYEASIWFDGDQIAPVTQDEVFQHLPRDTTGECRVHDVRPHHTTSTVCTLHVNSCSDTSNLLRSAFPSAKVYDYECYDDKVYANVSLYVRLKLLPENDGVLPPRRKRALLIKHNALFVKRVIQSAFPYGDIHDLRVFPTSNTASFTLTYSLRPPDKTLIDSWLDGWAESKVDTWMESDITFPSDERYELNMDILSISQPRRRQTKRQRRT